MAYKPLVLQKYDIILENDDDLLHEDLVRALKLIFNMNWKEANDAYANMKKFGQVILERVHKEKLDLRKDQINTWSEKGKYKLPVIYVKVTEE